MSNFVEQSQADRQDEVEPLIADIIAMLRYGLRPDDPGRPLEHVEGPVWRVPIDSPPSTSASSSLP